MSIPITPRQHLSLAFIALGLVVIGVTWWEVEVRGVEIPWLTQGVLGKLFHYRPISGRYLLYTMPLAATVVVFARMILGVKSFGLFTPMLMAMAFLQTGPVIGPLILSLAIGAGLLLAPALKSLRMARVGFLAALMSIVCTVLIAVGQSLEGAHWATAFPVVVTALAVERWWVVWEGEGLWESLKTALSTLCIAITIEAVVLSTAVAWLVHLSPYACAIVGGCLSVGCGMYRGLRINELHRFKSVRA